MSSQVLISCHDVDATPSAYAMCVLHVVWQDVTTTSWSILQRDHCILLCEVAIMQTVTVPTALLLLQTRQARSQPVRAWPGLVVLGSSALHDSFAQ